MKKASQYLIEDILVTLICDESRSSSRPLNSAQDCRFQLRLSLSFTRWKRMICFERQSKRRKLRLKSSEAEETKVSQVMEHEKKK